MKHKPRMDQSDLSWKFVFWYTFTNLYMYRKRNWTNEFWQPLCGEWMGDVLRTENLPQHISRSLLRSTQQSCTWKPDRTGLIFVITYQVPSLSETEHKMHINSNNTHTHLSLFIPQLFRSVFVQCYWLVCAKLYLFVLSFVLCPVLLSVTCPLTGCLVLFHLAGLMFALLFVLDVLCSIYVYIRSYSCLTLFWTSTHHIAFI